MKRILLLVALTAITISAWAQTKLGAFSVGYLTYTVNTSASGSTYGEVACAGLSEAGKNATSLTLDIPGVVTYEGKNYYVKTVAARAFYSCGNIKTVHVNYGVENIYYGAFMLCSNLEYARLPSSLKTIGSEAFTFCNSLTQVFYAATECGIESSYAASFVAQDKTTLYVPFGANDASFRNAAAFSSDNFPTIKHSSYAYDFLMKDGTTAIVSNPSTSTSTPHECTIIGIYEQSSAMADSAYVCTTNNTTPQFQDRPIRYTAVSDSAFYLCQYIKSLDFSQATTINTYGKRFASNCHNMTSATFASGNIGANGLFACKSLVDLVLDGVTSMGQSSLASCYALETLNIPASVTSVYSSDWLDGCSALTKINVDENNAKFASYDYSLYSKSLAHMYNFPPGKASVSISPKCQVIGTNAFLHAKNLKSVVVPFGVKHIQFGAFQGCTGLTTARIPSSVASLGKHVFTNCASLTDLYVNTNTAISISTAQMFWLRTITGEGNINLHVQRGMENEFKNAGWTGFKSYNEDDVVAYDAILTGRIRSTDNPGWNIGLTTLTGVTVTSTAPETINGESYAGRVKIVRGAVTNLVSEYLSSPSINTLFTEDHYYVPAYIKINEKMYAITCIDTLAINVNAINDNGLTLTGCVNVDTIGASAFEGQGITGIILPNVSYIGEKAFYNSSLANVTLSEKKMHFGSMAFVSATGLSEIVTRKAGFTYDGQFFGNNNSDFMLYVDCKYLNSSLTTAMKQWSYSLKGAASETCDSHVVPCFEATGTTFNLGIFNTKLDFKSSNVKAYVVSGVDHTTGVLTTSERTQGAHILFPERRAGAAILTDLIPGEFYKIKRQTGATEREGVGYLYGTNEETDLSTIDNAFYWDIDNNKFVKVTDTYNLDSSRSYMVLNGATRDEYYLDLFAPEYAVGDVNGDGVVDVTDVNILVNITLGADSADNYDGRADVDGNGSIDVSDINAVINIMLGK